LAVGANEAPKAKETFLFGFFAGSWLSFPFRTIPIPVRFQHAFMQPFFLRLLGLAKAAGLFGLKSIFARCRSTSGGSQGILSLHALKRGQLSIIMKTPKCH
jgi:hypothetical protein